jgi:potassium/hydrogen antiporter
LIIRNDRPFFPDGRERIQAGDELLIVTPEDQRLNTEERLRAIGQRGRLARWRARG